MAARNVLRILTPIAGFLLLGAAAAAPALDGLLDTSYSGDGKATVAFASSTLDQAFGAAPTADGKVVLVGRSKLSSVNAAAWTRLLANGSVDPAWGKRTANLCGNTDSQQLNDVAIQSTGDAIAVGTCVVGGRVIGVMVRLSAIDGSKIDEDTVDFNLTSGGETQLNAVAIGPGDVIVAAGSATTNVSTGDTDFAVARFLADGTPDPAFDGVVAGNGRVPVAFPAGFAKGFDVGVQSDGRIVVVGNAKSTAVGGSSDLAIARLHTNGSLDSSFAGIGLLLKPISATGTREDRGRAVFLLPDGRIAVAGSGIFNRSDARGDHFEFLAARFLADGSFDSSFNFSGVRFFDFAGSLMCEASDILVQSDGRTLIGGTVTEADGSLDFGVVRFGTLGFDNGFGSAGNGHVVVPFDLVAAGNDRANAMVFDSGRALLVGQANVGTSNDDFAIARLTSDLIFADRFEPANPVP